MSLTVKQKAIKFLTPILLPVVKIYWRIFKPSTYGAKVVIQYQNKFLIVRNSYGYKSLSFVGGRIDKGETPQDAAIRETKEEVGLDILEIKYLGMITSNLEGKEDNIHIFHAKSMTDEIKPDEFEISEAFWTEDVSSLKLGPISHRIWQLYLSK